VAYKVSAEVPVDYLAMKEELADDRGFCAVIALAAITGLSIKEAQAALKAAGRKPRCGTPRNVTKKALEALGFKVTIHGRSWIAKNIIAHYPDRHRSLRSVTTHHPRRFAYAWANRPNMLLFCTKHVCAFINGVVMDWTIKHSKQVNEVWFVEPDTIQIEPLAEEGE
jgi:hypothetical protein